MGSFTRTREELTDWTKFWGFSGENLNFLWFSCKVYQNTRQFWVFTKYCVFFVIIFNQRRLWKVENWYNFWSSPLMTSFQKNSIANPFKRNLIFHIDFQIKAACLNWYRRYTPQKVNLKARVLQIALHNEIVKLKGKRNYQFLGGNDWIFIVIHSFLGFIWKFQCKIKSFPKCKHSTLAFYALSKRFFSVFRICVNGNNANWWKFLNL